jgi:hypothetical protein
MWGSRPVSWRQAEQVRAQHKVFGRGFMRRVAVRGYGLALVSPLGRARSRLQIWLLFTITALSKALKSSVVPDPRCCARNARRGRPIG